jgi:hypothetical protein
VTGDELFSTVTAYSDLGIHRTATDVDRATCDWFADRLRALGAEVELRPYELEQWLPEWTVTVDGGPVDAVPLWYRGLGEVSTDEVWAATVEVGNNLDAHLLDAEIERADAAGAAAIVLGTRGLVDAAIACNRSPRVASGAPVLLIAAGALAPFDVLGGPSSGGRVSVAFSATSKTGMAANVIGRFGAPDETGEALVLATPLSGWFTCAGERGTGIAVLLSVLEGLLAEGRRDLLVVGTTGHELGFYGLEQLLDTWKLAPKAVLHVGASVAAADPAADGTLQPSGTRVAMMSDVERSPAVMQALAPASLRVLSGGRGYMGEAELWSRLGCQLLSLTGTFSRFHTADDRPELVTTPDLLGRVANATLDAVGLFAP